MIYLLRQGDPDLPLKALIFDSYYDSYLGVVVYVRIFDGRVHSGDIIRLFSTNAEAEVVDCRNDVPVWPC